MIRKDRSVFSHIISPLAIVAAALSGGYGSVAGSGSSAMHAVNWEELPEVSGEVLSLADGHVELGPSGGGEGSHRYAIGAGDAAIYKAGDRVRGRVNISHGERRLEHIWPDDPAGNAMMEQAGNFLRRDTVMRGSKAFRGIGETVPEFSLYNERGEIVSMRSFRGRKVVINFIFSRCSMPAMCPAATTRMSLLQAEAKKAGMESLQLLSVSFDPAYDTPGILAAYARNYGVSSANYSFLTGGKSPIKDLLKQFGVDVREEGGTLNHTMSTILIDERGRIVFRRDGSRWEVGDFLERVLSSSEAG